MDREVKENNLKEAEGLEDINEYEQQISNDLNEESEIQNSQNQIEEISNENVSNSVLATSIKTHKDIIESAKASSDIVKEKYDEYIKTDLELEKLTINFIRQENHIIKTTVETTINLLNKLNANTLENSQAQISEIQKDNKEELMHIKTPSKGSAKGFTLGLIGSLISASAMLFVGSNMANLPLNLATLTNITSLNTIATKYSELLNMQNTPTAGYALIGIVSLSVGFGLYKLTTWLQKKKNIKYISQVEEDLVNYTQSLNTKMDKIKDLQQHIENIQLVMQKYDIILQEQNAKIRRMLFIEQPEDGINSLQRASRNEVEKTVLILDELLQLMNTPINNDIEITQDSDEKLHSANSFINEVIKKLYI